MHTPDPKHWTAVVACLGPVGHLPKAPGTWGTAVTIPFAALLIQVLDPWQSVMISLGLALFAVWCCGAAERYLQARDPGCVVLDECVAVPCCYLGPLLFSPRAAEGLTRPDLTLKVLMFHLAVFLLFRFFDILKPWPVGISQRLPGGWGVVMDDLLAAGYVNGVLLLGLALF
ncbi:MAG: phosphatidylglycerophosphatase A [Verrucomicrobiota bacterium]|nr:phosphatidylglycerophosphatase A [Verrucomicrobiota bacterium]